MTFDSLMLPGNGSQNTRRIRFRLEERNGDTAALHVDCELPIINPHYEKRGCEKSEALRKKLEGLPGIAEVYNSLRYQLNIRRGGVFSWEEILPSVLMTLADHLNFRPCNWVGVNGSGQAKASKSEIQPQWVHPEALIDMPSRYSGIGWYYSRNGYRTEIILDIRYHSDRATSQPLRGVTLDGVERSFNTRGARQEYVNNEHDLVVYVGTTKPEQKTYSAFYDNYLRCKESDRCRNDLAG